MMALVVSESGEELTISTVRDKADPLKSTVVVGGLAFDPRGAQVLARLILVAMWDIGVVLPDDSVKLNLAARKDQVTP